MWWNLPIEEVEELARENKLNTMTCVEYDDTNKKESEDKIAARLLYEKQAQK